MSALGDEGVYDADELAAIERAGSERAGRRACARRDAEVSRWRRTGVSGSLATAVLLGLREALEPPADGPAIVVDHDGGGDDEPVTVHLDPVTPRASVALIRD